MCRCRVRESQFAERSLRTSKLCWNACGNWPRPRRRRRVGRELLFILTWRPTQLAELCRRRRCFLRVPAPTKAQQSRVLKSRRWIGSFGFAAFSAILTVGAGESTLENMAVALAWQKQGIGKRLLTAGLLWCRAQASDTVFLEVRQSNQAAITLYERAGFLAVGNRPGYYREPTEDGLQMQKTWVQSPRLVENSSC